MGRTSRAADRLGRAGALHARSLGRAGQVRLRRTVATDYFFWIARLAQGDSPGMRGCPLIDVVDFHVMVMQREPWRGRGFLDSPRSGRGESRRGGLHISSTRSTGTRPRRGDFSTPSTGSRVDGIHRRHGIEAILRGWEYGLPGRSYELLFASSARRSCTRSV